MADKKEKKKKSGEEGKKRKASKKDVEEEAPIVVEDVVVPEPEPEAEVEAVTDELALEGQEEPTDTGSDQIAEEEAEPFNPRRKPSNLEVNLSIDKYNELRAAFDIFDFNHDGVIDKEDLVNALIAMGENIQEIDEEELDEMIFEGYEPLDFESFAFLIEKRMSDLEPIAIVKEAMSHWDPHDTGLIPEEKFVYDVTHSGEVLSLDEIEEVLEDAPIKKEFVSEKVVRMIDYVKFCKVLGQD